MIQHCRAQVCVARERLQLSITASCAHALPACSRGILSLVGRDLRELLKASETSSRNLSTDWDVACGYRCREMVLSDGRFMNLTAAVKGLGCKLNSEC